MPGNHLLRGLAFDLFLSGTAAIGAESLPLSVSVTAGRPAGPLILALRFLLGCSLPLLPLPFVLTLAAMALAGTDGTVSALTVWGLGSRNAGSRLRKFARPT